MSDQKEEEIEKSKRGRRKREKVELDTNFETLSMNAFETRNAIGIPFDDGCEYPKDFFSHPGRYR